VIHSGYVYTANVDICHERADDGGQIEQRIPVSVVPGQATCFISQNHTDPPQRERRDECLEAWSLAILARASEVGINDMDLRSRPAEVKRTLHERILVALAFLVMLNLFGCRLTHVNIRLPFTVPGSDLVVRECRHAAPPCCAMARNWQLTCRRSNRSG
jgi:hypothetical protein